MEDALKVAQRALYTRISNRSLYGIFTRPSILVLADEARGKLPIQALNQVCRRLMSSGAVAESEISRNINLIAEESGFDDMEQFTMMFQSATGWHPEKWYRNYCRDTSSPREC